MSKFTAKILAIIFALLASPVSFIIHIWSIGKFGEEMLTEWMQKQLKDD